MTWHLAGDKPLQDPMMTMPHFKPFPFTYMLADMSRTMGHETSIDRGFLLTRAQ